MASLAEWHNYGECNICKHVINLEFECISPCAWNSMDFHGIPWRIRTSISMEFYGNFSINFHGKYLHGGLGHFPWNSMENIRAPVSMEFHGNFCIDIFHGGLGHWFFYGIPGKVPCNSIETTPSIIPWISGEFHGIHRD